MIERKYYTDRTYLNSQRMSENIYCDECGYEKNIMTRINEEHICSECSHNYIAKNYDNLYIDNYLEGLEENFATKEAKIVFVADDLGNLVDWLKKEDLL